ncbi:phosphate ABC transporter permease PstA [Billgrantia bachuensis]|nr:phosphate ABC transporter permease PstA [Halomonas bachuensis]
MLGGLMLLIGARGLAHFWPASVEQIEMDDGRVVAGHAVRELPLERGQGRERLYFTGNRDLDGQVWHWLPVDAIVARERPRDLVVLERRHHGMFIGRLIAVGDVEATPGQQPQRAGWARLQARLAALEKLRSERERLHREVLRPLIRQLDADPDAADAQRALAEANARVHDLQQAMRGEVALLESADGRRLLQPLDEVLRAWQPNAMPLAQKLAAWADGVWRFLAEGPRDGNSAGGVWPAIFGTVLMVLLMSLLVTPFGVLAAVYLNEVAHQGRWTNLVRIAVRNLAGVPSIVYGVFGLGVFVYGIGGSLDEWFFSDTLPSPTFGTGGLLWASLTLALLTLPVVVVATEEGLARIPAEQREGALALGATRFETLSRVVLPMAVPAMLTGVILAVARAAGEVAPLLLVGVAKLAPQVPVDGEFPFLHLERKFMHLGYHIYDTAFHGSDVQAAMPLVFATALLLVLVILMLNLTAIFLRHYFRARHGVQPRP